MKRIIVIGTRHENLGMCNSYELFTIIDYLKPEVIFEELPPSFFDQYYTSKSRSNLESIAISMYLATQNAIQVLVDSDDVPTETFFNDYNKLMKKIDCSTSEEAFHYRNYIDSQRSKIENKGFSFINSRQNLAINNDINKIIKSSLQTFNDSNLNSIYESWQKVNETRENIMLNNIYQYCEANEFERAVFTIGHAHLIPLMEKIELREASENVRLKWSFLFQ